MRRLNALGISSRCAYGGTVPTGDEVRELDDTRLMVATPEALSGLLSAHQRFFRRISLVICDEGHLLGAPSRGIGLELLLARLKGREGGAPRSFSYPRLSRTFGNQCVAGWQCRLRHSQRVSPRIGRVRGTARTIAERSKVVDLAVHPHRPEAMRFTVEGFLSRTDFRFTDDATGRSNTLPFASIKTRTVAAVRKALPMGTSVIFAANKHGDRGAVGIAEELLQQLSRPLTLPNPVAFANAARLAAAVDYLRREFGDGWIGTRALAGGAVLHHGDIPQETREVWKNCCGRRTSYLLSAPRRWRKVSIFRFERLSCIGSAATK